MYFSQWIQKELFFFASLAFVFVATASVSSFVKHHIQQNAPEATVARVVWPDNQPAIYPETPPPAFFAAQKEEVTAPQTAFESVVNAQSIKAVVAPHQRPQRVNPPTRRYSPKTASATYARRGGAQAPVKVKAKSYRLSHYKATQAKKAPRPKAPAEKAVDTQAMRAYEVHMKWVRKTLAEYQTDNTSATGR